MNDKHKHDFFKGLCISIFPREESTNVLKSNHSQPRPLQAALVNSIWLLVTKTKRLT